MKSKNKILTINIFIVSFFMMLLISVPNLKAQKKPVSNKNIKAFIDYKLAKDNLLDNVDVIVNQNTITLKGSVPTLDAKNTVMEDVHEVTDEMNIVDNLAVEPGKYSDAQITKNVLNKITKNMFYTVFDWVSVETNNGVVTLKGWINMPWNKSIFQKEAEKVSGVTKVINDLKRENGSDELRIRAARVIYNNPGFEMYAYDQNPPIHIIVLNGSVILKGNVPSEADLGWAQTLVEFHTDAINVVNDLKVQKS